MSKDLLKRLYSLHKQATIERSHFYVGWCAKDAIHRIEELEDKLAYAREALEAIVVDDTWGLEHDVYMMCRAALRKLKGRDDDN